MYNYHYVAYMKQIQYCISTIFQFKKRVKKIPNQGAGLMTRFGKKNKQTSIAYKLLVSQ